VRHLVMPGGEAESAAIIDFLASPASGVINGAMIPVYGKA